MTLQKLTQAKLPFKASYWLRRDIDNIRKVYIPFAEAKQELFNKYAVFEDGRMKMAEDNISVVLQPETREEFWKEYAEMAEKEVPIEVYPLKLDWFDGVEGTVEDLYSIDFMLEE
jgi:hypothetical protein